MANRKFNNNNGKQFKKSGSKQYGKKTSNSKGKSKPKAESIEDNSKIEGNINNPSYYYGDATVLEQVMNFSFNEFGGVDTELNLSSSTTGKIQNSMVASYWLNPSMPATDVLTPNSKDGVNVASLRNYLMLSGSNAKTTMYAPQDVTLLIFALAEIIKVATFIARAFGIAYLFNYRNRSYPETLLIAMGIDPTIFADNLAAFRVRFNKILSVASRIPFPADVPLFKKAAELYSSLYLDDPSSALAQTYMFCPYSTWLFDEAYDANGAGLKTIKLVDPANPVSLGAVLTTFENMVNALITSTSLNSIYSDVMRLAQNGKMSSLITFNSIPEDFVIVPVYNEEIKAWIHNAIIVGVPLPAASQYTSSSHTPDNDVSCAAANNSILYCPQFQLPVEAGMSMLLDFDHDNVSVEDKVRATRLSQRWLVIKNSQTNKYYSDTIALADEYLVEANFYTGTHTYADLTLNSSFINPSALSGAMWTADVISKFDWAPLLYYIYHGSNNTLVRVLGDLDYYTAAPVMMLKRIYDYEIIHLLQIG